jgi:predicted AlkP superfamily phosphohydrolase/phosphomutase
VDSEKGHKSKKLLIDDLFKVLEKRVEAYRHLWDKYDWDVFMFVITGSDRIEHFLWDAYEDPNHENHEDYLDYFKKVDEAIGEIADRLEENDSLIMISDHGMETVNQSVNLNAVLQKEGLLKLGDNPKQRYNNIVEGTKAFALEDGRIYINREGKYPRGSVNASEVPDVMNEIVSIFESLEKDGQKIVKNIYKRDDIYHGDLIDKASDLVLTPNKGFNLRGKLADEIFEESPLTGMHNPEAFIYVKSKNKAVTSETPSVEDVVPIINSLLVSKND